MDAYSDIYQDYLTRSSTSFSYYGDDDFKSGKCYECVFWGSISQTSTRDYGCSIWDFVEGKSTTPSGYNLPDEDGNVCASYCKYVRDLYDGVSPRCCDCSNWDSVSEASTIDYGCSKWDSVERIVEKCLDDFLWGSELGNTSNHVCPKFKWAPGKPE